MRLRGKEQVFRRIHVVPYGEREAWLQCQKRKSAFKESFQLEWYVRLTVAVKRIHIRDIQESHRDVDNDPYEQRRSTTRSAIRFDMEGCFRNGRMNKSAKRTGATHKRPRRMGNRVVQGSRRRIA
jgi:hypothetical protein